MLLTDEDISRIRTATNSTGGNTFARMIEAAVLAKLREQNPVGEVTMAAVLPESNGLYLHEFYCDSRLPVQAELFIRPAPIPEVNYFAALRISDEYGIDYNKFCAAYKAMLAASRSE